jgi:hypothetical protein
LATLLLSGSTGNPTIKHYDIEASGLDMTMYLYYVRCCPRSPHRCSSITRWTRCERPYRSVFRKHDQKTLIGHVRLISDIGRYSEIEFLHVQQVNLVDTVTVFKNGMARCLLGLCRNCTSAQLRIKVDALGAGLALSFQQCLSFCGRRFQPRLRHPSSS